MAIAIIEQSAQAAGLSSDGPVPRPLSDPPCQTRSLEVPLEGGGNSHSGLWECSPGRFERQVAGAEVMHILSGRGSFTPAGGGAARRFAAGDTLFFPARTFGVWDIEQTVRKVYVVIG